MTSFLLRSALLLILVFSLSTALMSLIGRTIPYDGEIRYILRYPNNTYTPYALDVLRHISYPMRAPIQAQSAQWSPDNRFMIIRSEDATYLWDVVSKNMQLVHASDVSLLWSPDATHLVFLVPSVAGYQLYLANGDGTGVVAIRLEDFANYSESTFSPDSTYLAFIRNADVYIMNLTDSSLTNLTDTRDRFEYQPIWSPDGGLIAYLWQASPDEYHLGVISLDRQYQRHFTLDANIINPVWSSDNAYIHFIRQDFSTSALYSADLNVEAVQRMHLSHPVPAAGLTESWLGDQRTLRILWSANDGGNIAVYEDDVDMTTGELLQRETVPMVGYPQIYDEEWLIYAEGERICIQSRATGLTQDCFGVTDGSVVDLRWLAQEDQ